MQAIERSTKQITEELETLGSVLMSLDKDDDARVARIARIKSDVEDLFVREHLGEDTNREMKQLRSELLELEAVPDKRRAFRRQIQIREVEKTRAQKLEAKKELENVVEKNLPRIKEVEATFITAGRKLLQELDLLNSIYSLSGKANEHFPGRTPKKVFMDLISNIFFPTLRGYIVDRPRDEKPLSGYLKRFK